MLAQRRLLLPACLALIVLSGTSAPAFAQSAAVPDQAPDHAASNTKSAQKAQKKAESKARRTQRNAELSELKKRGYSPTSNQTKYPENLQNAERKINEQDKGEKPASAP
ncbi:MULTISPECIES: hypothetical protein [Paraburkholderia]|uniref:hypothetical protein n=1 Tax=Paraburkholderia TaxID=1822464 RepID=UPI0032182175